MEVDGITFMAERIWRRSQEFAGIFIYEEKPGGEATAVTAQRGSLDVAPRGEQSTLLLQDGVRLESRAREAGEAGDGDTRAGVLKFSQFQVPIDLVGQDGFRPRGEDERELTLTELWRDRLAPPEGVNTHQMLAEFHDRVVRSLSVLFLPFLAVPFALGPRRMRHAYGIAAGLIILVAYNQLLAIGKSLASIDRLPSLAGQWLPFVVFAIGSLWLFYRSAYRVPRGAAAWSPLGALQGLLQRQRGGGALKRQHPE